MFFTPRSYVFIGLNIVRALSLIACILVLASSVVTLVHDIQAVNAYVDATKSGSFTTTPGTSNATQSDPQYIANSTVPNQPAGAALSVMNRLLIIAQVILISLSELGWPQRLFDRLFPILGRDFGLGALGIMQLLLACQILSHFVDTFALFAAFFLGALGALNILLGLVFRQHARPRRALTAWRERAKDVLPAPVVAAADTLASRVFHKDAGVPGAEQADAAGLPERFAGLGFGRQGEKAAMAAKSMFISRPLESLPRYAAKTIPGK